MTHPWGPTLNNVEKRLRTQPAQVPTWVDEMKVYQCTVDAKMLAGINVAPVRYVIAPNELSARVHMAQAGLIYSGLTTRDAVDCIRGGYSSLRLVVLP